MSYSSNFNLNWRVSYLESEIAKIAPIPIGGYNLANVLTIGNSAGANDIDVNNNDILQVNNIDLQTINGSAYPPAPAPTPDLSAVLTAGNTANNSIVLDDTLGRTSIFDFSSLIFTDPAYYVTIDATIPSLKLINNGLTLETNITNTQIQIIDNDPALPDPVFTRINKDGMKVKQGSGQELETNITNQQVEVRFNNEIISSLTPSSLTFIDTTSATFQSTLNKEKLEITNGNTGEIYSVGLVGNDFVISSANDRLLLNSGTAESYWGDYTAGTNANIALNIGGACRADIDTKTGVFSVGDLNSSGNNTKIIVDDSIPGISLLSSDIGIDSGAGITKIGDVQGSNSGTLIDLNDTNQTIILVAGTGVKLSLSTIIYPVSYFTTNQTFNNTSRYSNTFNGASLTATLPVVSGTNVGSQYLITNTNATTLTVTASGGQLIYSSFGTAVIGSKNLVQGHSHIFTAIYTTSAVTFGWSMV
jgi:hypothetical protein